MNKKRAKECKICFKPCRGKQCRRCAQTICNSCLKKWKKHCKPTSCPFCRVIWDKPDFYIQAQGGAYEEQCITIYCGKGYSLHPIHDDSIVGYVVLDPERVQSDLSFHIKDLEKLEPYAADINTLVEDLKRIHVLSIHNMNNVPFHVEEVMKTTTTIYTSKPLREFIQLKKQVF